MALTKIQMTPFRIMAVVAGVAAVCLVYSALSAPGPSQKLGAMFQEVPKTVKRQESGKTMRDAEFWSKINLLSARIPQRTKKIMTNVTVNTNYINIMGTNTFYREANPPASVQKSGEVVVLLHGMAYKSETWLDLGTITTLAAVGHRVIAIDLPGFGETKESLKPSINKGKYLQMFFDNIKVESPIIVAPSMGGGYAMPYIVNSGKIRGFVPIAATSTLMIGPIASSLTIPTLIIYGEKDHNLGIKSRDDLLHIPTSQAVMIPDAGHPAYKENPEMFHTLLYNFVKMVRAYKVET